MPKLVTCNEVRDLVSTASPESHLGASLDKVHEKKKKIQATSAQNLKQFFSLEKQNLNYTLFPKYLTQRAARGKHPKDLAVWSSYLTWKWDSHVNAACGFLFLFCSCNNWIASQFVITHLTHFHGFMNPSICDVGFHLRLTEFE